jgi:acetyl esterase/lipase
MRTIFLVTSLLFLLGTVHAQNDTSAKEIIYGRKDGIALTMLQLTPRGNSKHRAIVRVMAGSWFSSYGMATREGTIELSKELYVDRGYTVFEVIVSSQPRFAIPEQINDVKRAVRYIRFHAKELGIDPGQIGIEGYSAGGHLSLAIATADEKIDTASKDPVDHVSSRVQAAAVLFPPTDFLNWPPFGNVVNAKQLLLTYGVYGALDFKKWNDKTYTYDVVSDTAERNKIGREISPLYFVTPDDPPIFIIHGDADQTVPLEQSQAFIAKLKDVGVPNNYIIKKGAAHDQSAMMPEMKQFTDWFDKYLK